MFSKGEFFGAIVVAALIGIGVGYSKAREICMEALIKALPNNDTNENEIEEES